ncbi:MaoC/PaaZ C-terminal domain-containing protein [Peribacillus frigoritolerans]|uniref:MaoC/PaaZ C-terminal domain-containing protein n=1 Tax=Peribacillus frigoritolerans TaxID=450367 RepID=UPI0032E4ADF0
MGMYGEEYVVGTKFLTPSRTITESDVMLFAGMTGDNNPLHTDEEFSKKNQFGSRIAHGMLVSSVAVGLFCRTQKMDGTAVAALDTKWKYLAPVLVGDTIHCVMEVGNVKRSTSKPERCVVTMVYRVLNSDGKLCQEGEMSTMLWWSNPLE